MKLDLKEWIAKTLSLPVIVRNESFVGSSGQIIKTQTISSGGTYLILARANATTGSAVPAVRITINNSMLAQNADAGGSTMSYVITKLNAGDVIDVEYSATNIGAEANWNNIAVIKLGGVLLSSIFKAFSHFREGGGVNESRFERTYRFHAKENKHSNVSRFGSANILCTVNLDDTGRSNRLRPSDIFLSDLGNDKYIGLQKYTGFRSSRASNYHISKLAYKCRWSRIKFYNASKCNNYRALTHSGRRCVA